jgi:antitoxin (DNA-binding transcriptional repressor) of toxin-antitoxin stability system
VERAISGRELTRKTGEILAALGDGDTFVVVRNGRPVAELRPYPPREFVSRELLLAVMKGSPRTDAKAFRRDVDEFLDNTIYDPWERSRQRAAMSHPPEPAQPAD